MKARVFSPFVGRTGWLFLEAAGAVLLLSMALLAAEDTPEIPRLVEQLGDDSFDLREAASKALDKIGEAALPHLRKALQSADLEVRQRASKLVEVIAARARAATLDLLERAGIEMELGGESFDQIV